MKRQKRRKNVLTRSMRQKIIKSINFKFDFFYENRVQFCKQFKLLDFLQRFITKYYYRIDETIIVANLNDVCNTFFFYKIKFSKTCFSFVIFKFRFFFANNFKFFIDEKQDFNNNYLIEN